MMSYFHYPFGGFNPFEKCKNGNLPQVGVKINDIQNHHLEIRRSSSFSGHEPSIFTAAFEEETMTPTNLDVCDPWSPKVSGT